MSRDTQSHSRPCRRAFLSGLGAAGVGAVVASTATARSSRGGFPPERHTEWSEPAALGDGEVRTFETVAPSGKPLFAGVELTESAATMDADEFAAADLVALEFPGETVFEWLGLNWGPDGHGPPGVYDVPHHDIHFYLDPREQIEAIPGVGFPPYESDEVYDEPIAEDQIPPEYFRTNYVVPQMGEHLFDASAPEWAGPGEPSGEPFTHTHVWGHWDGDLNFYEPMITTEFFAGLEGDVTTPIAVPDRMPAAGYYPTAYTISYHGNDGTYTVALESFQPFEASTAVDDA